MFFLTVLLAEHLVEAEGHTGLPQIVAVVEDTDGVFHVAGEEHVAQPADEGAAVVAQVVVRVHADLVAQADVVLDEGAVAPFGEVTSRPVLVVGPANEQVDPGMEGLLEEEALSFVLGPPGVDGSVADVGRRAVAVVEVAHAELEVASLGVGREAGAVDGQVALRVAPASHGQGRGARPVVHAGNEPPAVLCAELPVALLGHELHVGVLHRVGRDVVFHADHDVVTGVGPEAEAAPVPLVGAVVVGEGAGVAGEAVDLDGVGRRRCSRDEQGDEGEDQDRNDGGDQLVHGFFLPLKQKC